MPRITTSTTGTSAVSTNASSVKRFRSKIASAIVSSSARTSSTSAEILQPSEPIPTRVKLLSEIPKPFSIKEHVEKVRKRLRRKSRSIPTTKTPASAVAVSVRENASLSNRNISSEVDILGDEECSKLLPTPAPARSSRFHTFERSPLAVRLIKKPHKMPETKPRSIGSAKAKINNKSDESQDEGDILQVELVQPVQDVHVPQESKMIEKSKNTGTSSGSSKRTDIGRSSNIKSAKINDKTVKDVEVQDRNKVKLVEPAQNSLLKPISEEPGTSSRKKKQQPQPEGDSKTNNANMITKVQIRSFLNSIGVNVSSSQKLTNIHIFANACIEKFLDQLMAITGRPGGLFTFSELEKALIAQGWIPDAKNALALEFATAFTQQQLKSMEGILIPKKGETDTHFDFDEEDDGGESGEESGDGE